MFIQYCSESPTVHCPKQINGWPDMSLPEKILIIPAVTNNNNSPTKNRPKALETIFDYMKVKKNTYSLHKKFKKKINFFLSSSNNTIIKIKKKTEGIISYSQLKSLHPGNKIPEIFTKNISTETIYHYNISPCNNACNQLSSLTVTKYPAVLSSKKIYKNLFNLPKYYYNLNKKIESLTIRIVHKKNLQNNTRSTSILVNNFNSKKTFDSKVYNQESNIENKEIDLGTNTYSLENGIKIEETNPLTTLRTVWTYDRWNRPIKKSVIPANEFKPKTTTWHYIYSDNENAVIINNDNGTSQKVILNGYMQVLSTWFKVQSSQNFSFK